MFINYAHRGASAYAPENTFMSFYLGIIQGADGIETDVQKSKDGLLTLFHDTTLERVTGQPGTIADYTFEQLQKFKVLSPNGLEDRIISLDEFLRVFSWRNLTFALEIKYKGYEKEVVDKIYEYHIEDKVYITSFIYEVLEKIKKIAPEIRIGYLLDTPDENSFSNLIKIGGEQICPYASKCTKEFVKYAHNKGVEVRAWGVQDTDDMKYVFNNGLDGATLNFPDELVRYEECLIANKECGDK